MLRLIDILLIFARLFKYSNPMKKSYRSRVGRILACVLVASSAIVVVSLAETPLWVNILCTLLYLLFVCGSLWIRYDIIDGVLHIRTFYALFDQKIDIAQIKLVERSNNVISSPAASCDRLLITYNKYDEVLISPVREEEFVADLQAVNPDIVYKK